MINEIKSDWYALPQIIKEDIFLIEKNQCQPKFHDDKYRHFIVTDPHHPCVSNKFKRLKEHLFGLHDSY